MQQLLFNPEYIFDSSAIIKMRDYPPDLFKFMWDNIDLMFKDGKIISCKEVYREVAATLEKEDDASRFAKKHSKSFKSSTPAELSHVLDIMAKFPGLTKEDVTLSDKPQADPLIIAQAIEHNCDILYIYKNLSKMPKKYLMYASTTECERCIC